AYIIYTSGSTGTPKGVMIEHLGMLNHMYSKIEGLEFNTESIVSQNSPFTFDISIWQLLTGLLVGARVVVYDQSVVLDPDDFLSKISLDGITILEVVPSYLKSLLEVEEALERHYLGDLSYLLVTGEAVSSSLLDRWFIAYPSIPVVNAYGPTEASDDITVFIMDKAPGCSIVPVGKPIRNMQIYILDSQLRMCGKGVSGEICVSGVGVGRGYMNRPDLTSDKFIVNPLDSTQRLYRTGDIGRWLEGGILEFQGRIDDQVKIRGHRIELGEIEYQLQGKDGIDQAVVVAKALDSGSTELIAYIVSDSEQDPSDLIGYLLERLPDYMVPGYYLELSSIPLTSNGKVDKKRLPLPEAGMLSTGSVYVAPRTSVEEQLVAIWEDVLERTPIGIQDDFFALGGNSIKAIKVINLIQGAFKIRLKVLQLFQDSTIEVLAKAIET
ncbi:AMP-binding protein, partial [Aquimarina sp. M1]